MPLERLPCGSHGQASHEPDTSRVPSGEKATAITESVWSVGVRIDSPVVASQRLTVSSADADASVLLSGDKATAVT
jgi:hypothetical protein